MALIRRLFRSRPTGRISGPPRSSNGASSFHVWWDIDDPLASVSAVIEVVDTPAVARLYFFALQASFWSDRHWGGAHTGLQWNPRHPGSSAVNWGGYDDQGAILSGSQATLPSTPDDPNTRDYPWRSGRQYRLTIGPVRQDPSLGPVWPAWIHDLESDQRLLIRELSCEGTHLRNPVVWSEIFADCDDPPIDVRWSDLRATILGGDEILIERGRVSYQSHADGGCANTTVLAEGPGFLQRSNSERAHPHDQTFAWTG